MKLFGMKFRYLRCLSTVARRPFKPYKVEPGPVAMIGCGMRSGVEEYSLRPRALWKAVALMSLKTHLFLWTHPDKPLRCHRVLRFAFHGGTCARPLADGERKLQQPGGKLH